jgi:hypothetical protein
MKAFFSNIFVQIFLIIFATWIGYIASTIQSKEQTRYIDYVANVNFQVMDEAALEKTGIAFTYN